MRVELNQIDAIGKIFLLKEVISENKFPFISSNLFLTRLSEF